MTDHDAEEQHPRDRPIEPADPMQLTAEPVDGDPRVMLDSIIEEYAGLGWNGERIAELFAKPFFQATWGLTALFGPEQVRARIDAVLARRGVMRFVTTVEPEPDPDSAHIPEHLNCAPPSTDEEGEKHA